MGEGRSKRNCNVVLLCLRLGALRSQVWLRHRDTGYQLALGSLLKEAVQSGPITTGPVSREVLIWLHPFKFDWSPCQLDGLRLRLYRKCAVRPQAPFNTQHSHSELQYYHGQMSTHRIKDTRATSTQFLVHRFMVCCRKILDDHSWRI